jgi:phage terminase large subunit-like protein
VAKWLERANPGEEHGARSTEEKRYWQQEPFHKQARAWLATQAERFGISSEAIEAAIRRNGRAAEASPMKHPHCNSAERYCRAVVAGKIEVCEWVRLACQRHLDERKREREKAFPYRFDKAKAERACDFIELLHHTKGKWAAEGQLLKLEPWQCLFVVSIFGWVRKADGLRRLRKALMLVPRKNAKSTLSAAIGLYMLAADGEVGAEVYSGATTERQAWEVFRPARLMALKAEQFREHYGVEVNASNISIPRTSSRFEPIIGKPGDGPSPSCGIVDEYHEHDTDHLFDALQTGMGARRQPFMLVITTAGVNMAGPCYGLQIEAQRMPEGAQPNDQLFALVYGIDPDDDWAGPETLAKANPNIDVSISREFLEAQQKDAIDNARKQSTFKTKHLNVWVGAREAFFNVWKWQQAAQPDLRLDDFAGQTCYLGMDLASKIDIAAVELLFPRVDGTYARFGRYYLPEATVETSANEHYQTWAREGWLTVTDGDMIDHRQIRDDILDFADRFSISELAFDPDNATMLVRDLMDEGISCVECRPTRPVFSDPMKTLDALIRAGRVAHNGDPIMTWAISNTVTRPDAGERVYPMKERPENKIDPVVALIMALARALIPAAKSQVPLFFAVENEPKPLW